MRLARLNPSFQTPTSALHCSDLRLHALSLSLALLHPLVIVSGEVLPQRRSCVETLRAPSLPLVAPPLGFPRYRAPEGALKGELISLEAWKVGVVGVALPHTLTSYLTARNGGRRSRSAAKPQSDRWSPKRFAPPPLRLGGSIFPDTPDPLEAFVLPVWHVADVPGVQGERLPAGVWGGAPHASSQLNRQFPLRFQLFWQSACASTPLICSKSVKSAVSLRLRIITRVWW